MIVFLYFLYYNYAIVFYKNRNYKREERKYEF